MLLSLAEYGKLYNKSNDTVRRLAEQGILQTAKKIGRNWVVDSCEKYPVKARNRKKTICRRWKNYFPVFRLWRPGFRFFRWI